MYLPDPLHRVTAKAAMILLACCWLAGTASQAEMVNWYSVPATNLTSTGAPMGADFSFELGVFKDDFVPTADNTSQWAAHWVPAQRATYNATLRRFDKQCAFTQNTAPFVIGADAYVWGFRGGVVSSEWILFRSGTWTWPAPEEVPPNPNGLYWNAAHATAVLGSVNASGSPFLMQSAAVTNSPSPVTTWEQWQASELAATALNGPNDDPDHDGVTNQLEFIFGTPPGEAGPPPQTPVVLVDGHLQITIPRRIDRAATLVVEVSSDLSRWDSGPAFTEEISNTPAALVVRTRILMDAAPPQSFMRLASVVVVP